MQLEQDDSYGRDPMDPAEDDRKSEADEDINLDAPLPLCVITFEIDVDIDITLCTLCDMDAVDYLVQSAAPQTSARSHSTQEKTSEIGIGGLWW